MYRIRVQYDEVRAAIAQRREAKRRVKRVLLSATATEEPLPSTASTSTSASTSAPVPASAAATAITVDRLQSMEPLKEKPRLISAAIDPKVFPDSDDDDDDPITLPATVRTPGDEDLPFESSCSTLDSPLVTFAVHCTSPASSSPPNSPSALEASIGTDWRAGLASAENDDDDDDDDEVVEKAVEKVQAESKSSKGSDREVQSVTTLNSTAEGETEIEDDDDATQCADDINCSPKQAHFTATAKPTSNTNGLASIEVKCSAMTIQERMRSADAAAAARTAHGAAQSEPRISSSSAAATAAASRESRELWMGPLSPKPSPSPLVAASSPAPVPTSVPSLSPTGGGVTVKDQGANRESDRDGDGGEDLGEIVIRSTPEKPCKDDYSSGSQSSEKLRLNQSSFKTGAQKSNTHSSTSTSSSTSSSSSSSGSSSSSTGHNRHQHHTTKLMSLNNINATDSKTIRHSQGQQKGRCLADALTTKKTTISKPTCDTFYGKKS